MNTNPSLLLGEENFESFLSAADTRFARLKEKQKKKVLEILTTDDRGDDFSKLSKVEQSIIVDAMGY